MMRLWDGQLEQGVPRDHVITTNDRKTYCQLLYISLAEKNGGDNNSIVDERRMEYEQWLYLGLKM